MRKDMKTRRRSRIRAKIAGTSIRPRASVFRSNSGMYVQLIDDSAGKTLLSFDISKVKGKANNKVELAKAMGKEVAVEAKKKEISKIVFDRSGYKYHGRIKALADGMRDAGMDF